jgi:hypothetical protein
MQVQLRQTVEGVVQVVLSSIEGPQHMRGSSTGTLGVCLKTLRLLATL